MENKLQYHYFFEASLDGMLISDPVSGAVVAVNPVACEMLEMTEGEIYSLKNFALLNLSDPAVKSFFEERKKKGKAKGEFNMYRKNGITFLAEVSSVVFKNENGEDRNCVIFRDITERKEKEQNLYKGALRYRTLFEQNLAGIYQTNLSGLIINCNDAFARMLKYTSCKELHNTNAYALYFSEVDRDKFVNSVRERRNLSNYESVLKCKDGSPLYVIENIFLRTDPETGEEFCDGIMIDISERKLAEIELKDVNLKYQALFDNPLNAFVLTNSKGDIVDANNSACKMFGYNFDEFIGLKRVNILDVSNPQFIEAVIKRDNDGMSAAEIIGIKKNGQRFPISFVSSRFYNANGEERRSSLLIDITERKLAEINLKDTDLKYKALFENPLNSFLITDKNGNVVDVNISICKMFGYTREEFLQLNRKDFVDVDNPKYIESMKTRDATGMAGEEIIGIKKNGERFPFEFVSSVHANANGDERRSSLLIDVSERKKLEEKVALEKAIKQKEITEAVITAQESERSQIGMELHDNVNQLLSAAKLYMDMAKTDDENKEIFLNSSSSYTYTAIEEIRKLSKTLITPLIKDIGLTDLIKNLMEDIMQVQPVKVLFKSEGFDEDNLNEKYKLNVFRIVQEQINNILKHAKAKLIEIKFQEKNNHLIISITDDGVGFDTKTKKRGVGISNIISRAELYKGEVTINSEPGKGCRLVIDFIKSDLTLN